MRNYAYQLFLNLPFGANERKSHAVFLEVCERSSFAEQRRSGSFNNPYKFNDYGGKSFKKAFDEHTARSAELDPETGLYYYGARYYNPRTSVFISIDPLTEQTMTPYQYTYQNPVRYIDPDGKAPQDIIVLNVDGSIRKVYNDGSPHITIIDPNYKGRFTLSSYSTNRGLIYWNNRNRQIVANVAEYYRKQAGLKHIVNGVDHKPMEGTTAYTTQNDEIYIASQNNRSSHPSLNNKYNLMKTLYHENLHVDENINGPYQYSDHASVYLKVMLSGFYSKADEQSQMNDIYNFVARVQKSKDSNENGWLNLINIFNDSNIKGGYKIRNRDSGGIELINPKGNPENVPLEYYLINSPHD